MVDFKRKMEMGMEMEMEMVNIMINNKLIYILVRLGYDSIHQRVSFDIGHCFLTFSLRQTAIPRKSILVNHGPAIGRPAIIISKL